MRNAVRYFAMFPWPLAGVLTAVVVLTASSAGPAPPVPPRPSPRISADESLSREIAARAEASEEYHKVAGAEHRAHGYPTTPAVVFREPTTAWFMAASRYAFLPRR